MREIPLLLTANQAAYALNINNNTLDVLVHNGIIPHTYIQGQDGKELRFDPYRIADWMQSKPQITLGENEYIDSLRTYFTKTFPETIETLQTLDGQFSIRRKGKGYNLVKVPNKRYGFLYYVRYIEKGKLIYSRWNTHTNNEEIANQFAEENREKILHDYYERKQQRNAKPNLYKVLKDYYKTGSVYFEEIKKRGRRISPKTQNAHNNWIHKILMPFLRRNKVIDYPDVTPPLLAKLQTELLAKGNNPRTVNRAINGASTIFDHLVMNGIINENVFKKTKPLRDIGNTKARGCYEINKIAGVFNHKWREELEYFLNLIIYTTDMRNSEIEKIQPQDIIKIKDCHFINIQESKSENGIRIVPIHPFVYNKITAHIKKYRIPDDGYLFSPNGRRNFHKKYTNAALTLGEKLHSKLGIALPDVKEYLRKQNITFYSGRYFWKTLMNANGLGDVEEYFMGHKISNDVAKRYNRKDKVGQDMLLKKAREVFRILDRWVFKTS